MGFFLGLFQGPRLDGVQKSMNICYKISEREGVHVRVLRGSLLRSSRLTLAFYMAHLERNIQRVRKIESCSPFRANALT